MINPRCSRRASSAACAWACSRRPSRPYLRDIAPYPELCVVGCIAVPGIALNRQSDRLYKPGVRRSYGRSGAGGRGARVAVRTFRAGSPGSNARRQVARGRCGRRRPDVRCDLVAERDGRPLLVEIKAQTPQTNQRSRDIVAQLKATADRYRRTRPDVGEPGLVVAFPGVLSPPKAAFFDKEGVEVWDGRYLQSQARQFGVTVPAFVAVPEGEERFEDREPAQELLRRLSSIQPGRTHWPLYENFCEAALNFLFCPPLKLAIPQSRDGSRANRRDFILPNYAQQDFWRFLRDRYGADFVVTEVKNTMNPAGKEEVLQLANYLTRHGTGLVGILMTRNGLNSTAQWISREQWVLHDKLIIGLGDEDIRQMLLDRQGGRDPSELIQQRIEDFRLRI